MIPSITDIRRSLSDCRSHFDRLADMRPADVSDDRESLRPARNTMFAEFVVEWRDGRWLLSTPLTAAADEAVERLARMSARLRSAGSKYLAEIRVFRSELMFTDSAGGEHKCDVVMQRIPDGCTLERAGYVTERGALLDELAKMQEAFKRMGFAHNNLKAENIIITEDNIPVAVRYHFARLGADDFAADGRAFVRLREIAASKPLGDDFDDCRAAVAVPAGGYEIAGPEQERRIRIRRDGLCGFADPSGEVVIEPQFDDADDFREGRACVDVGGRKGLIDKSGRFVIAARYDELIYDDGCGISLAESEGVWSAFDYEGHPTGIVHEDLWRVADMLRERMKVTIEI